MKCYQKRQLQKEKALGKNFNNKNVTFSRVILFQSYRNDPKFSDRYAWANSADPEEQSDQDLHCLPFRLHHLD